MRNCTLYTAISGIIKNTLCHKKTAYRFFPKIAQVFFLEYILYCLVAELWLGWRSGCGWRQRVQDGGAGQAVYHHRETGWPGGGGGGESHWHTRRKLILSIPFLQNVDHEEGATDQSGVR